MHQEIDRATVVPEIEQCNAQTWLTRNVALRGRERAGEQLHEGGFTGAIPANNRPPVALRDGEGDVLENVGWSEIDGGTTDCYEGQDWPSFG